MCVRINSSVTTGKSKVSKLPGLHVLDLKKSVSTIEALTTSLANLNVVYDTMSASIVIVHRASPHTAVSLPVSMIPVRSLEASA